MFSDKYSVYGKYHELLSNALITSNVHFWKDEADEFTSTIYYITDII